MRSDREQKSWDEIVGNDAAGTGTTGGRLRRWTPTWRSGARVDPPAAVIGGLWGAIMLTLFGVFPAALAVGTVSLVAWLLWRFLPYVGSPAGGPGSLDGADAVDDTDAAADATDRRRSQPRHLAGSDAGEGGGGRD